MQLIRISQHEKINYIPEDDTEDEDAIPTPLVKNLIEAVASHIGKKLLNSRHTLTKIRIALNTAMKQLVNAIKEHIDRLPEPEGVKEMLDEHETEI